MMDKSYKYKQKNNKAISISEERELTKMTLRKQNNKQMFLSHILHNVDDTSEYELSEKDFDKTAMNDSMQHDDNSISFALWLFNLRNALSESLNATTSSLSSPSKAYSLIKSLTNDQVNALVDILLKEALDSKLKYESCWVLINLVVETNAFNDYFVLRIKDIYTYLFQLLNHDTPTKICFVFIRHILWLLSNLIEDKDICDRIREEVNIPLLIQSVFTYISVHYIQDTSPFNAQMNLLTEVNMQLLDYFLSNTSNKLYFQYKSYISNISEHIKQAHTTNNDALLKECFEPLHHYTLSLDCIELLVIDTDIIEILIKTFESSATGGLILINIIKNSKEAINIIKNFDIINRIVLLVLKSSQYLNKVSFPTATMRNTICLLNAILSYESFQFLIEKMVTDNVFLGMIPKIYHHYDISVQFQIFKMYQRFFTKGFDSIMNILISVNLHKFAIHELKSILDNPMRNSANDYYNKTISIILKLFGLFFQFGEKDKINYIQKDLENEDVISILDKLQYDKCTSIYEKANELLAQYWKEDNDNEDYYVDDHIDN